MNETHESTTDPDAGNYKKSKGGESRLAYPGHSVIENCNGLIVKANVTIATGRAEREAAIERLGELQGQRRRAVAADKNYDTKEFVASCRKMKITPHVARHDKRKGGSAIDGRTSRHEGYTISMKVRKRVGEPFGWPKTVGPLRQVQVRGLALVNDILKMTFIGWNLTRMKNVQESCAQ